MNKSLPDKHVRKAIYTAFNNTVVDGETVKVYDSLQTNLASNEKAYILMSSQGNDVEGNKCESFYNSDILLEVCTWYKGTGNPGSRLLADNILDKLRDTLKGGIDISEGGLEVISQLMSFPNDLVSNLPNGTLIRKFLRLELVIK